MRTKRIVVMPKLKYDVKCGSKVVIPAGSENVGIIFRGSRLTRYDETIGKTVNLNTYFWHGKVYHA